MYSERTPRILNRLLPEVAPYERPALTKAYIHPPTAKFILGEVLPNLPIRLQRFVLYNPPWFVANVLLPIVTVFMSAKVKSRLHICKTREELHAAINPSMLPEELGGTQPFDLESWAAKVSK